MTQIPMQPVSLDIWSQKYQLRDAQGNNVDQDMSDNFKRVARALADIEKPEDREKWYTEFLWALENGALGAGRIMSNAGGQMHKPATSLINCTVSGTIKDSMKDILDKAGEAGLTLKSGAGIGYCFSTLRPKGAFVAGAGASTSGPLSFMDIYDKVCFTVSSAGGRRGAQMATFDIGHPDVIDFIKAKRAAGQFRQFNLSVLISKGFMEAVKADKDWKLAFPLSHAELEKDVVDLQDPEAVVWREWPITDSYVTNQKGLVACRVYKTLKARRLWDVIMASTYDYAEPGFLLIDKANEMNNNWFCEYIQASNPCVTGDTWVHTSEGPRQVYDLIGKQFKARVNGKDWDTGVEGFFKTADKQVIKLHTVEGYSISLTKDHKVLRIAKFEGKEPITEWVEAGSLISGDSIVLHDHSINTNWEGKGTEGEGYLLGQLMGDGSIKSDSAILSTWAPAAVANGENFGFADGTRAVMSKIEEIVRSSLTHRSDFKGWSKINGRNEYRLELASLKKLAESFGMNHGSKHISREVEQASSKFQIGFLRGLLDADGSVQGQAHTGISIRLSQSDIPVLEAAQRMLLRFGITSRLYKDRKPAGFKMLPDGKGGSKSYPIKATHELALNAANMLKFKALIGFYDSDKQSKLESKLSEIANPRETKFSARISSIEELAGTQEVFDVQVPGINAFDANGMYVHNCGEQLLPPNGSCLLGSINLTSFVKDPFTDKASFDWVTYKKIVAIFTRMLDNVVEINGLPLEAQRNEIIRKRRHGMGYLGLGSTLTMMKIKYGSQESIQFTEDVTRTMAEIGWKVGLDLAIEKGPAPIMEEDFEITEAMLAQRPELIAEGFNIGDKVKGKYLWAKHSKYMAQFDPNLIEDLAKFGCRFTHHSSIAPTGTISLSFGNNASNGIEPSFAHQYSRNVIRPGKKSKEKVDVFSYELLAYRELVDPNAAAVPDNNLPEWFLDSSTIPVKAHVDIQAAAQKWIDSSISKTINVPTDFPFDEFKDIYMYAYEKGLKGCTTFRFNPEAFQGVLVTEKDLAATTYRFKLEDGTTVEFKGNEEIEYDGELHSAANLYDALKEGYYGKF